MATPDLQTLMQNPYFLMGARMMGGGFGGCTINLVRIELLGDFIRDMTLAYRKQFNVALKTYTVTIENGTGKI